MLISFKLKKYISDQFYINKYAKKDWRDQRNKQFLYYLKRLSKLNLFKNGEKVLDVGCGSGELSKLVKESYKMDPTGVEINKVALAQARKKGIKALFADLEKNWPFQNNTFNLVIGVEIIEHLVDPDHFIKESKRVLKNNGTLIITTPNLANWFNRILFLFGYQPFFLEASTEDKTVGLNFTRKLTSNRIPVGHIRCFTKKAMTDLLNLHGFKNVQIIGGTVDCLPKFMEPFDLFMSYFPALSSDMIVVAKLKKIS